MTTKSRLLCAAILFGAGVLVGAYIAYPTPVPLPPTASRPLPKDVVPSVVVKEVKVPGPPPPARVVERVVFVTQPAPLQTPALAAVCPSAAPLGRVRLEASKFQGLREGKPAFGWQGKALCEVAPSEEPDKWLLLAESPFDLTQSMSEMVAPSSLSPPPPVRRNRLDLSLGASSRGAALASLSFHRRVLHKSTAARIFAPDFVGAGVGASTLGEVNVFVTVGKDF